MNQEKIGKFICEQRKKQNLTQAELAEKLLITDRAVSKWERGLSLPDASIMLDLCSILKITVSDLLSGEIVTMNNYNEKQEDLLIEMVKQKEESDKKMLLFENVIGALSVVIILGFITIAALIEMEPWIQAILICSGFVIGLIGLFFAIRIEQIAGYYECAHCGHKYVPKYSRVLFSAHVNRTRYMKCPACNKRSWQKKRISK